MRQIQEFVYILLCLQFLIGDVFTFDILSKGYTSDTQNIKLLSEWKCNSTDECTATDSVCSNDGLCECAPGYIFNADMSSCIIAATSFNGPCNETVQCSAYLRSGAQCIKNVCVCGPGYYYLHGRCNRHVGLFEKCKNNIDCYVNAEFEASICHTDGICKCSPGFYQREHRTCRREGKAVNDECTVDIDCTFGNATCTDDYVCAIKKSEEAIKVLSHIALNTSNIIDKKIQVGSNCTTDEDCKDLGNATCGHAGTCRCDRSYFVPDEGDKCIPELGESCKEGDASHIEKSICREGRWSCKTGTVGTKDNRKCREVIREYKGSCELDEQCYVFGPDATCNDQKECVCNETVSHYVESKLFCWMNKGPGEDCIKNQDCYVKDFEGELICNGTCGCLDGKQLNKNRTACINSLIELGGPCEEDDSCVTPKSVCKNKICSCIENYYELKKQCVAGINSTCATNEDCRPWKSECNSEICSCKPNYVAIAVNSCMPILTHGESCSFDLQCAVKTDAICASIGQSKHDIADTTKSSEELENKICICSEDKHYSEGLEKCLKKKFLGETCNSRGECYLNSKLERVVCRNSKCTCDRDYEKFNNTFCVEKKQSFAYSLNSSIINGVSTGLFSIILFIFSCKLF